MNDRLIEDLDTFMIGVKEDLEAVDALEATVHLLLENWCKTRGLHGVIFRRIKNRSNYRTRFSISISDGTNIRQIGNGSLKAKTLKLDPSVDFWIRKIIDDFFKPCGFVPETE